MHIGIQVTPRSFILAETSGSGSPRVLTTLRYPADDAVRAASLLANALPPGTASVMMNVPAAWPLSTRFSFSERLHMAAAEVIFVPTPLTVLHTLSDFNSQDIFWWEPWEERLAFGFISFLAGNGLTLEGYQVGSRADCIQAAQTYGYNLAGTWALKLCLRPSTEKASANLLPLKLKTHMYSEDAVLQGLTANAPKVKAWLEALKVAGSLGLNLFFPTSPALIHPLSQINNNTEYPYQQYSKQIGFTQLPATLNQDMPVYIIDQNQSLPLWAGTISALQGADLWVHPATGQIQVITSTRNFLPYQPRLRPQAFIENRLNVPLPPAIQDVAASLQLMLFHLKN